MFVLNTDIYVDNANQVSVLTDRKREYFNNHEESEALCSFYDRGERLKLKHCNRTGYYHVCQGVISFFIPVKFVDYIK